MPIFASSTTAVNGGSERGRRDLILEFVELRKEEEEVPTEPTAPATGQAWRRFVKALRRVRRLQRIWGNVGNFLKTFPASLRDRLRETHA